MVAIVSGNSLGLTLTSLGTLAQRGLSGSSAGSAAVGTAAQGRSGEAAYVNAATGNLVLQDRDDLLVGRGLDLGAVRTYNSQGLLSDDNADNWQVGAFGQSVRLMSGTLGAAGSTLGRTDRDGAVAVYTWDAATARYVSADGAGAFDTVTIDAAAAQLVWRDGDSARAERYESGGLGRLLSVTDADGNVARFAYDANGNLQSATSATGDISYFDYAGTDLVQIRTVSGGATGAVATTTVRYAYDASHRLASVTVDLTPEDNAVADGKTYVTRYTYDGASRRIATVAQADGTGLAFSYVQVGTGYKVQSVTFTASLAPDLALTTLYGASGAGRPPFSGSVTFYNDGVAIGTATVSNGSATLTVSKLALGVARITASYAGDANHALARSQVLALPVLASTGALASTSTLTATPASGSYGTAVLLTATVTGGAWPAGSAAPPPAPSGTVRFYDGDTLLGSVALASGKATLSVATLAPGKAALRAVYSGDARNATSTAAIAGAAFVVAKATTQTTLVASAASVVQGTPVTLTANVAGKAPGGLVTFLASTTVLGTAPVVAGQARLVAAYLPIGTQTLSATYVGDANNGASLIVQGPSIVVAAGPATVTPPPVTANGVLFVTSAAAVAGFPVRASLYPTQAGGAVSGSFSIFDGTTLIGSFIKPQFAALDLPALAVGTHTLTIVYSGDADRAAAVATAQVVVAAAPAVVTVGSSRTQSVLGAPLIVTASIGPDPVTLAQYGGAFSGPAASGTVTFYNRGVAIGTANVVKGQATLSVSDLPAGAASLTARYSGDGTYTLATSSAFTQQIVASPVATSIVLSTSTNNPVASAPFTLTATPSRGPGCRASQSSGPGC